MEGKKTEENERSRAERSAAYERRSAGLTSSLIYAFFGDAVGTTRVSDCAMGHYPIFQRLSFRIAGQRDKTKKRVAQQNA
jgi:hypothetical protein